MAFILRYIRLAAACGILFPALLSAQGERVTLRFTPKPEQVRHVKATMHMSTGGNGTAVPALEATTTTGYTITFGRQGEDGRFDADLVIDDMTTTTTMNGQPIPAPNVQTPAVGTHFGVTYDASGKVVDVRPPEQPQLGPAGAAMATAMKQMLEQINQATPIGQTIGVGETVQQPLDFPLPAPPGAPAASMHMVNTVTLKRIDSDGIDRIATFDSVIEGSATAGPNARTMMTMAGRGTVEVNVDGAFNRSATFEYTMTAQGGGAAVPPPLKMQMTMTTTY